MDQPNRQRRCRFGTLPQCARPYSYESQTRHAGAEFANWSELRKAGFPPYESEPGEPLADHRTQVEKDRAHASIAWNIRVKELSRMNKRQLANIWHAHNPGNVYVAAPVHTWNKDELVNDVLRTEFPNGGVIAEAVAR